MQFLRVEMLFFFAESTDALAYQNAFITNS